MLRRVTDRVTGNTTSVAIPCGCTREHRCPSGAKKARRLRMTQCAEGWYRDDEPDNLDLKETADDEETSKRLTCAYSGGPRRARTDDLRIRRTIRTESGLAGPP